MSLQAGDRFTLEDLNAAFASQSEDNVLGGKLTLSNSGSAEVEDVQQTLNYLLDTASTVNNYYVSFKKITFTLNDSAQSTDLTSGEISYSASSALNVEGALVQTPWNLCYLRRVNLCGMLSDSFGKQVVGRLSAITGGFRLTTRVRIGGTESDHSMGSAIQCELWFPVVFKGANRPTYDEFVTIFSDNKVQELPDASATGRGLMNTDSQSFAGNKVFNNSVDAVENLKAGKYLRQGVGTASLSGASQVLNPTHSIMVVSGGATSLAGAFSNQNGTRLIIVCNQSTLDLNLNDTNTDAENRFSFSKSMVQNESIECVYLTAISRWVKVG